MLGLYCNLEQKEEIFTVLKDWIKDADYAGGVIQHVINLGNTKDEFDHSSW
jgi:hypothetical protein